MRVKRYVVDNLPDAVTLIRNELGKDAVILETKDVKIGGFLGMFRKKKIEVMAAVDPSNKPSEQPKKKMNASEVELVVEQILKASKQSKEKDSLNVDAIKKQLDASIPASSTSSKLEENQLEQTNIFSQLYGSNMKKKDQVDFNSNATATGQSYSMSEEQNSTIKGKASLSSTEQFIVNELKNLRLEMKNIAHQYAEKREESLGINLLRLRLVDQELNDEWIQTLCKQLQEIEKEQNEFLTEEQVWQVARDRLTEWLSPYGNTKVSPQTRIIQLVGPTGVGKTTTIAKLAANYSIKEGKSVGLITADTYRIAAVEQLRTYANILNLPLEVVFSPLDLQRAYSQLQACEIILMDTAGRNFKNDIHVSEVNSLLQTSEASEAVLTVSLTSRTRDMSIIADKFSKFGVQKVVFTKIDEANTYGAIFNMIMQYGLQPLFITSGQNVPDDIEPFNINSYLDLLLGDPQHE